jgi:hypothetical protein
MSSGVYEPANAHHKFDKANSLHRTMYRSMFNENKSMSPKTEYHCAHLPIPSTAVSNGCERISSNGEQ